MLRARTTTAWVFIAALVLSCSDDSVKPVENTHPATIEDLHPTHITPGTVTLVWTAPGDDDMTGTAKLYDLRVASSCITPETWSSASKLTGEPVPRAAGSIDTMLVTGLDPDSVYYFAIKTGNQRGAWSSLSNCAQVLCFDNCVVTFPDPHLDSEVRLAIGKQLGDIYRPDLLGLTVLDVNDSVSNLSGLEYCVDLDTLAFNVSGGNMSDISPLAGCRKLRSLAAPAEHIVDLGPLAGLTSLERVILFQNDIADISALSGLTHLNVVWLDYNAITSIDALAGKTEIKQLGLGHNAIADISPLAGLTQLEALNLGSNPLTDLAVFSGMTQLQYLIISDNAVADISPLAALVNLKTLDIGGTQVSDITPLAGFTLLQRLYFSDTPVSDLAPVTDLALLTELRADDCQISDLAPLEGLVNLSTLHLDGNQIVDIAPLVANPGLATGDLLFLRGNPLSAQSLDVYIPALTARGVAVVH